ncbi:MAG: C4-dicarboxylate ABC transporter, partial [Candidatus Contendobacter sp.]|nr:C4-dicarboxylate ABC transporter [Candidatus Contendobacter sp.]
GAVPFVVIQVIMVALIIAFPALVTVGLDRPVDSGKPAQVRMLGLPEDTSGSSPPSGQEDAADLFKQLPKPAQ